jgi:hypothetical protein
MVLLIIHFHIYLSVCTCSLTSSMTKKTHSHIAVDNSVFHNNSRLHHSSSMSSTEK